MKFLGMGSLELIIISVLFIVPLIAYILAVKAFADLAEGKGYKTGLIWFIGLFATPIVAGLYTMQLPEKKTVKDELPTV